ncbi:MAG: formate dehydrogenase subunit alpha [Polyangiales bacterium]
MTSPIPQRVVSTICPFCGVGCGMGLRVSRDRVVGVEPLLRHPVSRGQLCIKGYASAFAIDPSDRLTTPLIKQGGSFREASWDQALDLVAESIWAAREELGPDATGVVSCARATNEDNYAVQKLARAVLSTNNVDHCARICHSPSVAGLRLTLGSGAMTNSIADIERSDLIVVFGCDPTENHTILGGRIMRRKLDGAKLLVVDPRKTRLARMADLHLQLLPGTNIALINGLLHIIFERGWEDRDFLRARVEPIDALRARVKEYSPERVAALTSVPAADLERAARMYTEAKAAFLAYGMGITQHATGTSNVIAISNLALAAGQVGRPGTGINPLRGQNNVQGACDVGALPDVYPGYQDVKDAAARTRFEQAWGVALPSAPGLTSLGMQKAARGGLLRALLVFGEDPVVTDPDQTQVEASLRALDMLAVCELTLTETAKLADVVLPAASFAEKDGTFTNLERRVQRVRAAVPPPGLARSDWQIAAGLAARLGGGAALAWSSAAQIFGELVRVSPIYSAMSYAALDREGLQWPCDAAHPRGTAVLHTERFPLGRARMVPLEHQGPAEIPDADYPLWLTTGRLHFHYGCGSMTRKSPLLERETPRGVLFIHPDDARAMRIVEGTAVEVRSRRGAVQTRAVLSDDVPPGLVAMPYHFKEAPSNLLTNDVQDPITKMPELKACAVRVTRLPEGSVPKDARSLHSEGGL